MIRLTELEPRFLKLLSEREWRWDGVTLAEADGIFFLCPKCFKANKGPVGTHGVICWQPHVSQKTPPTPGRWKLVGTGFHDLSLVAGSSSILLTGGCAWHGFVTKGEVTGED